MTCELKRAGGLPGHFTGTFVGCYIWLERLIVVDFSLCSLDTCESTPALAGAERRTCVFE